MFCLATITHRFAAKEKHQSCGRSIHVTRILLFRYLILWRACDIWKYCRSETLPTRPMFKLAVLSDLSNACQVSQKPLTAYPSFCSQRLVTGSTIIFVPSREMKSGWPFCHFNFSTISRGIVILNCPLNPCKRTISRFCDNVATF